MQKLKLKKKRLALKYNLHGFHVVARDSVFYGVDHCGGTKAPLPRVHKIVKKHKTALQYLGMLKHGNLTRMLRHRPYCLSTRNYISSKNNRILAT